MNTQHANAKQHTDGFKRGGLRRLLSFLPNTDTPSTHLRVVACSCSVGRNSDSGREMGRNRSCGLRQEEVAIRVALE